MWFVLRLYGQEGLRDYIRKHVALAHEFEALIGGDERFEITAPVTMGLVCFRMRGDNALSEKLNKVVNMNRVTIKQLYISFIPRSLIQLSGATEEISFA